MEGLREKLIAGAFGATGALSGLLALSRCGGGGCSSCFGCAGVGLGLVAAGLWSRRLKSGDKGGE